MLYQCTVQVYLELPNDTETTIQVPTFLLDGDILGIVSADHARRIAADMFHSVLTGRPSLTFVDVIERPEPAGDEDDSQPPEEYPACPICREPIDHCAGHGEHNLCVPGEPCEACAVPGHPTDDCPAS